MDTRDFIAFGISHWAAIVVTAASAVGLIYLAKSNAPEHWKRFAEVGLGVLLLLSVLADPLTNWIRYADSSVIGSVDKALEIIHENSYPLYLCDVVAVVLAIALFRRSQRLAEVGYLWGGAGTLQGLITPTLYFDWNTWEYYAFFMQHGGVPVAALLLVVGMGLKPQRGAFMRIFVWSWVYMIVIMGLNVVLGTNYGFLNGKPPVATLFDYMGPYPWYLITLHLIAYALYYILLLPFRLGKEDEQEREVTA